MTRAERKGIAAWLGLCDLVVSGTFWLFSITRGGTQVIVGAFLGWDAGITLVSLGVIGWMLWTARRDRT